MLEIAMAAPLFTLALYAVLRRRSNWAAAAGWVALGAGLLGMALQLVAGLDAGSSFRGAGARELIVLVPLWWAIQIAGGSVQAIFDATASSVGPRQSTMDPGWWFMLLVWAKVAILGTCLWLGQRATTGRLKLACVSLVILAVVIDAWMGRAWPWWGT